MDDQELYIEPDAARLLESLASSGGAKFRDLSLAEARAAALSMAQLDLPCALPCAAKDLLIDGPKVVAARLYSPDAETHGSGGPVIIYIHGGGWIMGNLEFSDSLCRHLATRSGHRVLSIDYRLAPEHPFPAAFEDVQAATRWVGSSPGVLGRPPTGVALAGDSAGGGLAAAVARHYPKDAPAPLLAVLMLYPVTDISRTTASYDRFTEGFLMEAADMQHFAQVYAPTSQARSDPRASPLLAETLHALPPTTLLTCGLDVLRDEVRAFAARLTEAGVDITFSEARGHLHGIATLRGALPSARIAVDRAIDDFVRKIDRFTALPDSARH
jgi:acetyl esterase